jgi:LmbE family N-acetylglucosaminyl deacetylase
VGIALVALVAAVGMRGDAPRTLGLPRHPRVLVVAPHPDDETIGAGGLIHRFACEGMAVRVVFVTNGDGYPEAVKEGLDLERPRDEDFVAFGELRQREALRAARRLGLTKHDVSFLGFPDGGLAELWQAHWLRTRPYTSPYTGEDSPPYGHAANPDVEYDGQDLTKAIGRLLADFRPSVVIMPHPSDRHPDHAHTSYFVTEALASRRELLPDDLVVLTYLIHFPAWPARRSPAFDRLLPDARVPLTAWRETALAPEELAAKRAALAEYRSQLEVMDGFLRSFLCRNELFGDVDGSVLARIAAVH